MKEFVIKKERTMLGRGAVPVVKEIFLKRTIGGKWVPGRKNQAYIFDDKDAAKSVLDFWYGVDPNPTKGAWEIVEL